MAPGNHAGRAWSDSRARPGLTFLEFPMPIPEQFPLSELPYRSPRPHARPVSGLAVAALVLGIAWLWGIGSILAVVLGHAALTKTDGRKGGQGLAFAGLVLGWIGMAALLIMLVSPEP
jgi:hypothetical protein